MDRERPWNNDPLLVSQISFTDADLASFGNSLLDGELISRHDQQSGHLQLSQCCLL